MRKIIKQLLSNPRLRMRFFFSYLLTPHPDEIMLKEAFEFASHSDTKGDYLEFGVWRGRSFIRAFHAWKYVLLNNKNLATMKFYAFDSFEGLPEMATREDKATGEFKKGEYACSEEDFLANIKAKGVELGKVCTVKGWYDKVLNKETKKSLSIKKASIIFVDADLYSSAVSVLDFVTDYIVDGTIIIFDDWYCFKGRKDGGEQKAFTEWLAKNPQFTATEYHKFNWKSNSFIINTP